jgi:hypothetical protein
MMSGVVAVILGVCAGLGLPCGSGSAVVAQDESPPVADSDKPDTDSDTEEDGVESPLAVVIDSERVTEFQYELKIGGTMQTPTASGSQSWKLGSTAEFTFQQRQFTTESSGPLALAANRVFSKAATVTVIGDDHRTAVQLDPVHKSIQTTGSDTGLVHVSKSGPMPRRQLDLLQMSCDPLACSGLLPTRDVKQREKWNTDSWVLPMLSGLEAVVEQKTTCELQSLDEATAVIIFTGEADGAAVGSASKVVLEGKLTLDRKGGFIRDFQATQKEKRSSGPVSPGLDVVAEVKWSQKLAVPAGAVSESAPNLAPQKSDLALELKTPWRLRTVHSREWHLFHQTASLLMLRFVRNGGLIAQCNISTGVSVAPGDHTPDAEFSADVLGRLKERGGSIASETTVRDDDQWRIRHVAGVSVAGESTIHSDYYLCAAASGEQYSFVFSYSDTDAEAFAGQVAQILNGLSMVRRGPAVPFR